MTSTPTFPEDIMKAAEDALDNALCHDPEAYGGSYEDCRNAAIKDIARAIMADRQNREVPSEYDRICKCS